MGLSSSPAWRESLTHGGTGDVPSRIRSSERTSPSGWRAPGHTPGDAPPGGAIRRPVRRLATIDKILLATMVPLWVAVFALHVRQVVLTGLAEPPVYVWAARESDGYPVVGAFRPELHAETVGLRIGDRLGGVGGVGVAGAGCLRGYAPLLARAEDTLRVPVVFERDGQRHTLSLALRRPAIAWYWIPALLGTAVTAVLVLLRAPDVQQARLFFAATMTFV